MVYIYSGDEYSSDDGNNDNIDDILCYEELSHSEIINRCKFSNDYILNAQLSSDKSILQEEVELIKGKLLENPHSTKQFISGPPS